MSDLHDTQPRRPANFPAEPPAAMTQTRPPQPQPQRSGPGCLAWSLLAVAAGAFTLLVAFMAGLFGYMSGQNLVAVQAADEQRQFINEQINQWIPTDIANGNVTLLGARIEGLASLTPPPTELALIAATGTQFALDMQPTATEAPTQTAIPTGTATEAPLATEAPTTAAPTDSPTALFDVGNLFSEAQAQYANGEYDEATRTLDAIMALDPEFQPDAVNELMFDALYTQARNLLRSGDSSTLSAGIVKANEAELYGDIGELNYERYIAGLYLDAASKEATNPQGAITGFTRVFSEAPNYLDTRNRLYRIRVDYGNALYEAFDFCPAVVQFQAAQAIQPSADIEQKLQVAEGSCSSGQAPAGLTPGAEVTPGAVGEVAPASTPTPSGPAPIGERGG